MLELVARDVGLGFLGLVLLGSLGVIVYIVWALLKLLGSAIGGN
jgi:hypothetical protein